MIQSVAIIGAGNVGLYLFAAFKNRGINCRIFSRSASTEVEALSNFTGDFDLCLICIPDDNIADLSAQLPICKGIIAHSSGTVSLDAIAEKHPLRAIFYPPMSLRPDAQTAIEKITFCLEAKDSWSLAQLEEFCSQNEMTSARLNSEDRASLHLAAVISHNFSNYLYHLSHQILKDKNLSLELLKPLLEEQVRQIDNRDPAERQTGPAQRKDFATLQKHISLLPDENSKTIYKLISNAILGDNEEKL
jgi:predicted short-subunit dehydrogenase-like oxidoreductase (DUF2520 family)